jgi:hypothetical protein
VAQRPPTEAGVLARLSTQIGNDLSAIVAVATPTAQAKPNKGGKFAFSVDGTLGGQAVGGTFNIASFKRVDGVLTAVGSYSSATPASAAATSINGTSLAGSGSNVAAL